MTYTDYCFLPMTWYHVRNIYLAPSFALALTLLGCGGNSGDPVPPNASEPEVSDTEDVDDVFFSEYVTPPGVEECSSDDIKRRVYWDMRDYYIYADQVPAEINLEDYDSPESLIEALRVSPDKYSSVKDAAVTTDLYSKGLKEGYIIWAPRANDGVYRFRDVEVGSPLDRAGIKRGDELISLNGRSYEQLSNDQFIEIIQPENSPVFVTVRSGDEEPRTEVVAYEEYRWITAAPTQWFASPSNPSLPKIGYVQIRSFLDTTVDEIDTALAEINETRVVDELIIDLRYNDGGRTDVARYLASVVGGAAVEGKLAFKNIWSDKYSHMNSSEYFEKVRRPLNLPRVLVLTTEYTASSSEIFINSLKPYIDVIVIGAVTAGKPYTSGVREDEYCGMTIFAMRSIRENSGGVSVHGGIQPNCYVEDNWETPINASQDPLVYASLKYVADETCNLSLADASLLQRHVSRDGPSDGSDDSIGPLAID